MTRLFDRGPKAAPQSLYVHVPFCTDRCTYCAFATMADRPALHRDLVDALLLEYGRRPALEAGMETVYFGGGTPGLLAPGLLERLLNGLQARSRLETGAEITLEVNPTNVSKDALSAWSELGITRLSIGIQTFDDAVLAGFGRHHDGDLGRAALDLIAEHWKGLWSADLLVGFKDQTSQDLTFDLAQLLKRSAPHISVYGLTIEPGTQLHEQARRGSVVRLEDTYMDSYDILWSSYLHGFGYERYEVSNFALPEARSRHNQAYWRNEDYLGIGPGASSSRHPLRWSNLRDTKQYLEQISGNRDTRHHVERLQPSDRLLESLGVGLRTRDGVDIDELERRFGDSWRIALAAGIQQLKQQRLLEEVDNNLRIPATALTRADSIAAVFARTMELPPSQ
ncbi:MAG: radical SAM family heme chaperone HemW [Planctomycetota bacterium]|nr:radical SAM family heme chaperone HemW [Planctomycetota bacterium]